MPSVSVHIARAVPSTRLGLASGSHVGRLAFLLTWERELRRSPRHRRGTESNRGHVEEVGWAASIEFLGQRRDVAELLAAMDVFAFPSHIEWLSGAVIEAMTSANPSS